MASIVSAGTTSATALNMSADTSGVLQLASNNGVVALTIDTSQNIGVNSASSTVRTKLMVASSNASDTVTVGTVSGGFSVTNSNTSYGLQFGSLSTGNSWIQSARMDGTATAYNLILQPGGGNLLIGSTSNNGEKLRVNQGSAYSPSTSGNMNGGNIFQAGDGGQAMNLGQDANGTWYNSAYANNAGVALNHRFLAGGVEVVRIVYNGASSYPFQVSTDGGYVNAGTTNAALMYISDAQIRIIPRYANTSVSNNVIDLGDAGSRFRTIYAGTGTINTSDATEKQDIQDFTDAEKRVAVKIKALFKTFRFKDAVAEKGDDARIHSGVVAQEVRDAFASEGLDAHRYALFCSDTWYTVNDKDLNDEGKRFTANDEGAVEHTKLGMRYTELLSFVISAL